MAEKKTGPGRVVVSARIDTQALEQLDKIGRELKPIPANRSEMVNLAVREYVDRVTGRRLPTQRPTGWHHRKTRDSL